MEKKYWKFLSVRKCGNHDDYSEVSFGRTTNSLIRNAGKNGLLPQVSVQKDFYCNFVGTSNLGTKRSKLATEIKGQFTLYLHLLLLNVNSIIESKGTFLLVTSQIQMLFVNGA